MPKLKSIRAHILILAGVAIPWLVLYAETFNSLFRNWNREDYAYCYAVPFFALYLAYRDRPGGGNGSGSVQPDTLAKGETGISWGFPGFGGSWALLGYIGLALSFLLFFAGRLGSVVVIVYFSMWVSIAGLVVLLTGNPFRGGTAYPLAVLLFAIPLPGYVETMLTFRLKLISTVITVKMLNLVGIVASSEGNIIDLGTTRVQVVDACSGLHYVLSTLFLALVTGYFFNKRFYERAALLVLALPLAVLMNSLRVLVMSIVIKYFSPEAVQGVTHDLLGVLVFALSLLCLVLMSYLLGLFGSRQSVVPGSVLEQGGKETPETTSPSRGVASILSGPASMRLSMRHGIIAASLLIAMCLLKLSLTPQQARLTRKDFSSFPTQIGEWVGRKMEQDPAVRKSLRVDDYLLQEFSNASTGNSLYLMIPYYEYQIMDRMTHNPNTCLLGSGWIPREKGILQPNPETGRSFPVQRLLLAKDDQLILTVFWFQQRGRKIASEYEYKMYLFLDSLFRHRSDGCLVRMDMGLNPGQSSEEAQVILESFVVGVAECLKDYIPE